MKKHLNIAYYYAIAAMVGGVFYREFTKFNKYIGDTALGKVHTHLFLLGMIMFMLIALFSKEINFDKEPKFKRFCYTYNSGLVLMTIMLVVRGVLEVLGTEMSRGLDAAISGIAGIGHVLIAIGIVYLFKILRK